MMHSLITVTKNKTAGKLGQFVFRLLLLCNFMLLAGCSFNGEREEDTIHLVSLSWPPFSEVNIEETGASFYALNQIGMKENIKIVPHFMPWAEAKKAAMEDEELDGYYPAWPSEVAEGFFASVPIFMSPLGLAEHKRKKVIWHDLNDLKEYKIAVVSSYIYFDEFQELIDQNPDNFIKAADDRTCLQLLRDGYVDAVAIDKFVMLYFILFDDEFSDVRSDITFNDHVLAKNYELVISFLDTPENRRRALRIKKAVAQAEVPSQELVEDYLLFVANIIEE